MKKRLLYLMASLLLCGAVNAQTNYWGNDPDSHAQPSNTPIVASVQIDGTAVSATADMRLGAFVGDNLRGIAAPHTDGYFWIQVFYADTTDNISFKFYDGTTETEYTTCETTLAGNDAGYGTPSAPQVLNFTTAPATITQNSTLITGWNWWSTPIEMDNIDGLTMLEEALGSTGIRIQSKTASTDYYDYGEYSFWDGQLSSITNEQMYKIRTNVGSEITLTGIPANPSNHTINISNGWNWIGFPSGSSISLETALAGFSPENEDEIKSSSQFAQFYDLEGYTFWDGGLTTLIPGQGYMYKSNSSTVKQLTFQTGAKGEGSVDNVSILGQTFIAEEGVYANNMTVTAVIELEGEILRSDDYELAAFVGNECRGSVKLKYVSPLDQYIAFLLIHGDQEESLRFVLTDSNEYSWSSDNMIYTNDATFGTPTQPVVLHFGPMGVDESGLTMIKVYPNPSNGVFNIEGEGIQKIEVVNAFGQIVYSKEIKDNYIQIDLSGHSIGAYLLRVVTNKGIVTQKIVKK